MKKSIAILLVLVMVLGLFAGCGKANQDTNAPQAGTNDVADAPADAAQSEVDVLHTTAIMTSESFNPLVNGNGDKHVYHALFDCLFMFDNDGNPVPMLAESYEKNGREVTIKMREDATFADGSPVKASDVVFSYETTLADPTLMYNMTMFFNDCEAVDDFTVKFTLANSYCKWMNLLSELLYIVQESTYDPVANDYTKTAPGGSGAYTLVEQDASGAVHLKAREDYWRLTPDYEEVVVYAAMDDATEIIALQTGEIDLAPQLGLAAYTQFAGDPNVTAVAFDGWTTMGLMSHVGDAAFRKAISYAINRDTILAICNGGNGSPSTSAFSPKVMGDYAGAVEYPTYDVEKAKAILAESKTDLSHTYTLSVFDADSQAVAQCVQQDLKAIGINLEVSMTDINVWFDNLMSGNNEFSMTAMATDMVGAEDMMSMFDPQAGYPFPLSDEALELVQTAPYIEDDAERYDAMIKLLNIVNEEGLWTALYDCPNYMAYSNKVGNINDCGAGTCVFYFADMTVAG